MNGVMLGCEPAQRLHNASHIGGKAYKVLYQEVVLGIVEEIYLLGPQFTAMTRRANLLATEFGVCCPENKYSSTKTPQLKTISRYCIYCEYFSYSSSASIGIRS